MVEISNLLSGFPNGHPMYHGPFLGSPVERLEKGHPFSIIYLSRKKGKTALLGDLVLINFHMHADFQKQPSFFKNCLLWAAVRAHRGVGRGGGVKRGQVSVGSSIPVNKL